jgi:hypothetical protein
MVDETGIEGRMSTVSDKRKNEGRTELKDKVREENRSLISLFLSE